MGEWHSSEANRSGAASIEEDPRVLAYPLARNQRTHCIDDRTVAAELGIPLARLDDFRRCGRPWPDPYAVGLSRLAEAFGADVRVLSRILAGEQR